jgi:YbbR domain-containing protein
MSTLIRRSFFQRIFVHNIGLKLVSLLFAIGLWTVVARDPIAEVEMKVPIEFHNLPDNLEIDSASFTEAQIRQVRVPQDLEVVQIIPGQFHLSFDNRETRTVEVRPRVIGNFASGMRVKQVTADPSSIMITGPRRRVEAVEGAITDPVDISGTMTRASFVTQAYVPDPLIQLVRPTPIRVTVIMERSGDEKK